MHPSDQDEFRQGRSCADSVTSLSLKLEEAFSEGNEVLAAFLDIKGAFPTVNIDVLLYKLEKFGFSSSVIRLVCHLTHRRFIHSECLGDDVRFSYTRLS